MLEDKSAPNVCESLGENINTYILQEHLITFECEERPSAGLRATISHDAISLMATGIIFLLYEQRRQFSGSYCELRAAQSASSSRLLLTGAQWVVFCFPGHPLWLRGQSVSLDGPAS